MELMRDRGLKILRIWFIACLISGPLLAEPVYEKLSVGMPLQVLNRLDLGAEIRVQDYRSVLTSYGIVRVDTESSKQYFPLHDKVWQGVKVEVKNNRLRGFVLQSQKAISKTKFKALLSDLLQRYGSEFVLKPYRSFYEHGHKIVWYTPKQMIALRVTQNNSQHCRVSIKKTEWLIDAPEKFSDVQKAFLVLEPLLGKDHFEMDPNRLVGN
jgi:hypothetical protein